MEKVVRINFSEKGQEAVKPLYAMGRYLKNSDIEATLQELIKIRVSQINGCAFCLDMHWKDARALGETEQRLYGLSVWNESPYYSERERAGLLWQKRLQSAMYPMKCMPKHQNIFQKRNLST